MKILIYGINYSPELTGIGKYTGEMATWLASAGHEVRVITGQPYYPEWEVPEGYSASSYRRKVVDGVDVWRSPLWVPKKVTGLKRLVHLATFAISSIPLVIAQSVWKPDVFLVVEPPFFCTPITKLLASFWRATSWLHIQDYEIDAAFDMGLLKGKMIRRVVAAIERGLTTRFDVVSTISQKMLERAKSKGVRDERLELFPNWVDISKITPSSQRSSYRDELGITDSEIVLLYSGNMGRKQGLEILADVAVLLHSESSIHFVFCGSGAARDDLRDRCRGMKNIHFLDLQPLERLNDLLSLADIHLLPQRGDAADLVMPSKLTGMLASGRPTIVTAHEGTELASVVANCGIVVPPEDPAAFVSAVCELVGKPEKRRRLGISARAYAEANLGTNAILGRFEQQLLRRRLSKTSGGS